MTITALPYMLAHTTTAAAVSALSASRLSSCTAVRRIVRSRSACLPRPVAPLPRLALHSLRLACSSVASHTLSRTNHCPHRSLFTSSSLCSSSPSSADPSTATASSSPSPSFDHLLTTHHRSLLSRISSLLSHSSHTLSTSPLHALSSAADRVLLQQTTRQVSGSSDLFMCVVVGEFNSGKTQLINALLGGPYLKAGVLPTTDTITILRATPSASPSQPTPPTASTASHSPSASPSPSSAASSVSSSSPSSSFASHLPHTTEVTLPITWLNTLSLVDTPGTNALLTEHTAITTHFLPHADLVLFVTSFDRPFSESERTFMQMIRQWKRRCVLIVNKCEQAADAEVKRVVEYVRSNARVVLQDDQLTIFPVSAKLALQAKQRMHQQQSPPPSSSSASSSSPAQLLAASNFPALEQYLFHTLSSTDRIRMKLLTPLNVLSTLLASTQQRLDAHTAVLQQWQHTAQQMHDALDLHEQQMQQDCDLASQHVQSLVAQRIQRVEPFVDQRLTVKNLLDLLGGTRRYKSEYDKAVFDGLEQQIVARVITPLIDRVQSRTLNTLEQLNQIIQHTRTLPALHQAAASSSSLSSPALASLAAAPASIELADAPSAQLLLALQQDLTERLAPDTRQSDLSLLGYSLFSASAHFITVQGVSLTSLLLLITERLALPWSLIVPPVLSLASFYTFPFKRRSLTARLTQSLRNRCTLITDSMQQRIQTEAIEPNTRRLRDQVDNITRPWMHGKQSVLQLTDTITNLQHDVDALKQEINNL